MKNIIFSLLVLLISKINGQIYYNSSFDFNSLHIRNGYKNVLFIEDTIYCIGHNIANSSTGIYIDKIDQSTELVQEKVYHWDSTLFYSGEGNSTCKIGNNNYCVAYRKNLNKNYTAQLLNFNTQCDTIWIKQYSDSNSKGTIFRHLLRSGNELLALGDIVYYDNSVNSIVGQLLLTKIDTLGNVIWKHEYGLPHNNEYENRIIPSVSGGCFICGSIGVFNGFLNFYLLKIDSLGNVLWQRTWGNIYHDELYDIMEMPNGNLLVCGYTSEDFFGHQIYPAYLAMLSPDGSQRIWEKHFLKYLGNENSLTKIFENSNGTYHIWGWVSDSYHDITRPLLMTLSSTFDSLDVQYYSYWNGSGAQNYIRDIVRMPDKGYVACGFGWDDTHDEDGWLLRIDSNGCANVSCTPLAIPPSPKQDIEVRLYPNPATNLLNISSPQPIQKIEIYNAQGQVVQTIPCNSIVNYQLIIVNYNNGIYFYTLTFANKSSARGKFMIQK